MCEKEVVCEPEPNPSRCPVLTKPGYHCRPTMDCLSCYTKDQLGKVERFAIWVDNVGEIEWEEPVDLCGLNLDKLITIQQNVIEVFWHRNTH